MFRVAILLFAFHFFPTLDAIARGKYRTDFLPTDTFRMPAEWEQHEAVWVGWELFDPFKQPSLNVIKALVPYVPVRVLAESEFSARAAKEYLHIQGIDTSKPKFYFVAHNRIWIRDHGAIFLLDGEKKLGFADFNWSHYGIRDWLQWTSGMDNVDDAVKRVVRRTGSVDSIMGDSQKASRLATDIIMEGGSLEVNGRGTLILCEAVTLQRNPGKTKEYIESEFRRVLGVRHIIWMKRGLADDPHIIRPITGKFIGVGTGGHTDEFIRFVNDSTVLLAWVDEKEKDSNPIHQMNYERMKENLGILERSRDQDGRPFRIIKFPLPDLLYKNVTITPFQKNESDDGILSSWLSPGAGFRPGDTVQRVAAASYLNFFVTNGVVLVPEYSSKGSSKEKETEVERILSSVFPGRKIVFVEVMNLNYEGGGIHCITQQQPARGPLGSK